MKDIKEITDALQANTIDLKRVIAPVPEAIMVWKSPADGWSVGEILEHLVLVEANIVSHLGGRGGKTERPLLQKVEMIRAAFESPGNRYQSPREFLPTGNGKEKTHALQELREHSNDVLAKMAGLDVSETLLDYRHPYAGRLTRIEWVYFMVIHARRHLSQIERLLRNR